MTNKTKENRIKAQETIKSLSGNSLDDAKEILDMASGYLNAISIDLKKKTTLEFHLLEDTGMIYTEH